MTKTMYCVIMLIILLQGQCNTRAKDFKEGQGTVTNASDKKLEQYSRLVGLFVHCLKQNEIESCFEFVLDNSEFIRKETILRRMKQAQRLVRDSRFSEISSDLLYSEKDCINESICRYSIEVPFYDRVVESRLRGIVSFMYSDPHSTSKVYFIEVLDYSDINLIVNDSVDVNIANIRRIVTMNRDEYFERDLSPRL